MSDGGGSKFVLMYGTINVGGAQAEANTREQTPWKRPAVADTPVASALLRRYESYRLGRETLPTVAYVALSAMQREAGGRGAAVLRYNIDREVLDTIGKLSSNYGNLETVRKLDNESTGRELTEDEVYWLESATRMLIMRIHDIESSVNVSELITMQNLPPLGGAA